MGNKFGMEVKDGKHCLEVKESLIRDFQDRIFSTDKATSSFVKAIDSTEAACEELLRKLRARRKNTEDKEDVDCELNDEHYAAKLLWTIKECVSDHKFVVLESLSKLVALIIQTGREFIDDLPELSIDKYRQSQNVKEKPYYDTRIEVLQKRIDLLKQKYKFEQETASNFKAKEMNSSKLKETCQKRIDELDKAVDEISLEKAKLDERLIHMKWELDKHGIVIDEDKNVMKTSTTFLETKLERMQIDIELLDQKYKMEKEKVDSLKDREDLSSKETEMYHKRIEELDEEVETLLLMIHDLESEQRKAKSVIENHRIEIDKLKRHEKKSHQDYGEIKQKAEENIKKTESFLDEIAFLLQVMAPKQMTDSHEKESKHGNGIIKLQNVDSRNSEEYVLQETNEYNTETSFDKVSVQMEEIKCHLKDIKEKLQKEYESHDEDSVKELQVDGGTERTTEVENVAREEINELMLLREKNLQLSRELTALKEKQVMTVQVYSMYGSRACPREHDLLTLLETSLDINSMKLCINELNQPTRAHPGLPLLIFYVNSYSYMYWSESSTNVLAKFPLTERMALVTFHKRDKKNITKGDVKEEYLEKLGGSFDFYLRENTSDYCFDEESLNAIVKFIKRNNPKNNQSGGKQHLGR